MRILEPLPGTVFVSVAGKTPLVKCVAESDAEALSVNGIPAAKDGGMFSVELVNCLGSCALAPVMVIDDTYHGKVSVDKLPEILDSYRKEDDE